jgi:hypothetical protein
MEKITCETRYRAVSCKALLGGDGTREAFFFSGNLPSPNAFRSSAAFSNFVVRSPGSGEIIDITECINQVVFTYAEVEAFSEASRVSTRPSRKPGIQEDFSLARTFPPSSDRKLNDQYLASFWPTGLRCDDWAILFSYSFT